MTQDGVWSAGRKSGIAGFSKPGAITKDPDRRAMQIYRAPVSLSERRLVMRNGIFSAALCAALLLGAWPAAAGTKDRLEALERAVQDLQAASTSTTSSALKISELEAQLQSLTGRVEELTFELDQANAKLASVTAALSGGAPGATGGPAPLAGGDPIADRIASAGAGPTGGGVELPLDGDAAFDYASAFLLSGDYDRAETAFALYVKAFPNHPRTPDAQIRLGEIYMARGRNADAADSFIAFIKKYPNDARAAEAYLKLGTAFSRMQQNAEACKVFRTMKSKFPGAPALVQERADVEMARIGCK
jgi:tol-pal system protein YbgF